MMPISTPRIALANGAAPAVHVGSPVMNGHFMMGAAPRGDSDPNSTHSVLEFTQQPPDSWYKDQFGRKATFDVAVRRLSRGCASCADHRHLNVQLLYESGKVVENQNILRVASGLCLNKDDQSVLAIRIMEVSKNHQNQRFRLQISLPQCPLKPIGAGVTCAISEPVLVLSKKNKRPVKADGDDIPSAIATKLKKSKHLTSPTGSNRGVNSPCSSSFNTPTSRNRPYTSPEFDGITESMPDEDQWGTEIVRFRQPTQGLCLWANAAFNFMHRLQWQHQIESSPDGVGDRALYRCPVCHATYASKPMHHIECDLALLLEQTGSLDNANENENTEKYNTRTQGTIEKEFGSPDPFAKPPMRPSLPQTNHMQQHAAKPPAFNGSSVDMLAKNLNLSSWEGYSSLSKIMFSLEADVKHTKEADPFNGVGRKEHKASDISMNSSLGSGGSLWSFATAPAPPPGQMSLNFSSILSSVKGLSPDTAAFLQEQEAELTGDASLLKSLSRVSLSDFLLDGQPDRVAANPDSDAVRSTVASLSTVMMDQSKSHVTENAVMAIASVDFRHCGHPAFDSSYSLVGFYFLSSTKSEPDLRFLPNFYPLPGQMLQDLDAHLAQWKQQPNTILHSRSGLDPDSLERLKAQVLNALLTQA